MIDTHSRFDANSAAFLKSSLFGLPLFIPPKKLRKLLVLNPLQLNSPFTMYPFDTSFCLSAEWSFATLSSPIIALVEKIKHDFIHTSGSWSARSNSSLQYRLEKFNNICRCFSFRHSRFLGTISQGNHWNDCFILTDRQHFANFVGIANAHD